MFTCSINISLLLMRDQCLIGDRLYNTVIDLDSFITSKCWESKDTIIIYATNCIQEIQDFVLQLGD